MTGLVINGNEEQVTIRTAAEREASTRGRITEAGP